MAGLAALSSATTLASAASDTTTPEATIPAEQLDSAKAAVTALLAADSLTGDCPLIDPELATSIFAARGFAVATDLTWTAELDEGSYGPADAPLAGIRCDGVLDDRSVGIGIAVLELGDAPVEDVLAGSGLPPLSLVPAGGLDAGSMCFTAEGLPSVCVFVARSAGLLITGLSSGGFVDTTGADPIAGELGAAVIAHLAATEAA